MRGRLANLFARRDDPYAGVDLANASRFGGGLWFVGPLFTAVLLPLVYDDDAGHEDRVELVAQLCMWLALAFGATLLMAYVRTQRLGLRRESASARRQARLDALTGPLEPARVR